MKNLNLFFIAILSIIIFSGCLKVNTKVNFNKDGSGTVEETVLMSDAVVALMKEFMSSFQDSTTTSDEFKLFKENELIEKSIEYGERVEYVSGEEIKIDGWEGYKAVYSFDDINQVTLSTDPNEKIESGTTEEKEHFTFSFTPGVVSELIITRPDINPEDINLDSEVESESTQLDDQIIKLMDGMQVKISLEFEEDVVETNAQYVDGSEVILFDIDFGKLLKNKQSLEMLKNDPPKNLDDMKAMMEIVPEIKIDLQKPIKVKF